MANHPVANHDERNFRDSTASVGFESIGHMLSTPYQEDLSDTYDVIPPRRREGPSLPQVRLPTNPKSRVPSAQPSTYSAPGKKELLKRIQSFEGGLHAIRESFYSDEDGHEIEIAVTDLASSHSSLKNGRNADPDSGSVRPVSILRFPKPTLVSPLTSPSPIRHATPPRPRVQIPIPVYTSSARLYVNPADYTIPSLPSSGTPVSPHLALPPLDPPRSPFVSGARPDSRGSMNSVASETSIGYDVMKEKHALFREGQEELLSPFSPRRQETGLRNGPRRGMNRGVSTVDFWKRFSVVVRLDQSAPADDKESAWLNDTQSKRRNIWWIALSVIIIALVIIGGIAAIIVVVKNNK